MSSNDEFKTSAPGVYDKLVIVLFDDTVLKVKGMLLTAVRRIHCSWFANEIGQGCVSCIVCNCSRWTIAGEMMFT